MPKDEKKRTDLAQTIGTDGRRLFEQVSAESRLPWLREREAIETLRQVWMQHYHASEQGTPWRADGELPPSAVLITSPYEREARYSRKKSTAWTGYKVHVTETCEEDAPHLIVEVIPTSATMADGDIVEELHTHLEGQQMLPARHLMDRGYVDAEILAESQSRYQVDIVGPVMPDLSWASKEAGRFDPNQVQIDWQTHQVICPAGHLSRDWGHIPDRHGQPGLRVRFPLRLCRSCPLHTQCTPVAAKVLILRPDEASYHALNLACIRQKTPELWKLYAQRAGIEGTVAQAVRTCDMRQARSIGSKKLRLQAFFTATSMNVLRACAWLADGTHASTPVSRFARLVAWAKAAAAA
ncbi:MAG TPA: transposase [Ktedonobacteraceae bacterium]